MILKPNDPRIYNTFYMFQKFEEILANGEELGEPTGPTSCLVKYFCEAVEKSVHYECHCPFYEIEDYEYISYCPEVDIYFWYSSRNLGRWAISKAYSNGYYTPTDLCIRVNRHYNPKKKTLIKQKENILWIN